MLSLSKTALLWISCTAVLLSCKSKSNQAASADSTAKTTRDTLKTIPCGFIPLNGFYFPHNLTEPDSSMLAIVSELLEATGMHLNDSNKNFFVAVAPGLGNAEAITRPSVDRRNYLTIERYVLYDDAFLKDLLAHTSPAAIYVLLGHEITHHLNGDSFQVNDAPEERRQRELAADSFSGFMCYKLSLFHHFTLQDCLKVYELIGDSVDTDTHPNKALREQVFTEGWNNSQHYLQLSCEAVNAVNENTTQTIAALSSAFPQDIAKAKQASLSIIAGDSSLVKKGQVITLRGDTPLFTAHNHNNQVVPLLAKSKLSVSDLKLTTTAQLKPRDTADYIIDKKHVIWARYPNGLPYIAGYTKTLN